MLDYRLLVACICIILASILYFFYWNRFVGLAIGYVIRLVYWNQEASSIWVDIGSVHFSFLAGRILLKDVCYHSSNQSVKIVKAQLQWRYWIRRPTLEQDIGSAFVSDDHQGPSHFLSCRVQLSLQGFEWFLYNRTAAYDNIVHQMATNSSSRPNSRATEHRNSTPRGQRSGQQFPFRSSSLHIPKLLTDIFYWFKRQLPNLDPLDLLPLGIEVTKGAIICGNNSTPNFLVAEFQRTEGTYGIVQSRSKYDLYKQILSLRFQHASVRYMENTTYIGPMVSMGESVQQWVNRYSNTKRSYLSYRSFAKAWRQLKLYANVMSYRSANGAATQPTPALPHPRKLMQANTGQGGIDALEDEYAIERKILEAPVLELSYYIDVVGEVPHHTEQLGLESTDMPEWGIDLVLRGGLLKYGPWADRQRAELQRAFFPPTHQDAQETLPPRPGDRRTWSALRVFIELRENTNLHIPFREASKNWMWDGQCNFPQRPRKREPALIHVTAGDRSSISYVMPIVTGPLGYDTRMDIHLDDITVTSSLNDIQLVSSESCQIRCKLPSPLAWNGLRQWDVAVLFRQPILYLIRDQINMLTDLGKDWATGPPSDYQRFIPMVYTFDLELHHFELNLYANDHNIIDKPSIKNENALLTLRGALLHHFVEIPSVTFRPESTSIPFYVEVPNMSIDFSLPRWHTHTLYAPRDGANLGRVGYLRINGSYRYYASVREDNVEQLQLNFDVRDIAYKAMGWSIRYFMIIRDNYFGSFTHFSTLYEYLDRRARNLPVGDPILLKYRKGKANMMEVTISLFAQNCTVLFPAGLSGVEKPNSTELGTQIGACIVLTFPELQLQFRMHDYFMEMSLNIGTISGYRDMDYPEITCVEAVHPRSPTNFTIDGISITANRLFGPQPRTATYVCIWEIQLGYINAALSALDATIMTAAGAVFRTHYADVPNTPAALYLPATDPDVTFYKFTSAGCSVTWQAGPAALIVSLPQGFRMDSNDLGGQHHRKVTSLRLPQNPWLEAAELVGDAYVDIYSSPMGWRQASERQRAFVYEQDRMTGRAMRMFKTSTTATSSTSGTSTQIFVTIIVMLYLTNTGYIHRSGVYLPQPIFSDLYQNRTGQINLRPTKPAVAHPRPPSRLGNLSESDEEMVSELDRDARLARTRSSTPQVLHTHDDEDMSSGDESDDGDLTDADSSDSDWSNLTNAFDAGSPDSLLLHYSQISRHFVGHHLKTPALWNGDPFYICRDRRFEPDNIPPFPSTNIELSPTEFEPVDDRDTTSYRFECRRTLEVRVNPLLVLAGAYFEDDLTSHPISQQFYVESLMCQHLGQFPPSKPPGTCIKFSLRVPSVYIRVSQHVGANDELHPAFPKIESEGVANSSGFNVNAIIDTRISGIGVVGIVIDGVVKAEAGFRQLNLSLNTLGSRRPFNHFDAALISLSLRDFISKFTTGSLDLRLDLHTIERECPNIMDLYQRWSQTRSMEKQTIAFEILRSSENITIIDPLTTIQPSYLVQTGIPQQLRTDIVFKLLFHLRACLRYDRSAREPAGNPNKIPTEDFASLLDARLAFLDQDGYQSVHLSSLESSFPGVPSLARAKSRATGSPIEHISIWMSQFKIAILDPLNGPASVLKINNSALNARLKNLDSVRLDVVPDWRSIEATFSMRRLHMQAAAKNLILDLELSTSRVASCMLSGTLGRREKSMNHSLIFDSLRLSARSRTDEPKQHGQDILASLEFSAALFNVVSRQDLMTTTKQRLIFSISSFLTTVPRSALRLYHFIQEWRADFLPDIEGTMQDLISELKKSPETTEVPVPFAQRYPLLRVNGRINKFKMSLQVMHGTWLAWEINDIVAYLDTSSIGPLDSAHTFGFQTSSLVLSVTSSRSNQNDVSGNTGAKLVLPPLSITGRYDGSVIHTVALLDIVELKIKPTHWDTMLAVQQKFGQDFNDLVALAQQTRLKKSSSHKPTTSTTVVYTGFMKIRGFRVGLEGLSSTLYLECRDVRGSINNTSGRAWDLALSGLALSLAPRAAGLPSLKFNRNHRSAFVIIDFKVAARRALSTAGCEDLRVTVTRINAVMQPSSIGEIGDFIDQMQTEASKRQEQRALELAAFKEKTQKILKTFEVRVRDVQTQKRPWFYNFIINVSVRNIGIAFPLTLEQDLEIPLTGSKDSNSVRAFLLSVKSIEFVSHRGETGQVIMKSLSFQFISNFKQSSPRDFSGEAHQTRNRLIYPEMQAHIRTTSHIWMDANVSGFILDLDSTIPDYVFSLIDVYRQGKERIARLSANAPRTPSTIDHQTQPDVSRPKSALPTSNILASLVFLSGKVRVYSASASNLYRTRSFSHFKHQPSDEQVLELGAEVFNLPVFSVWAEYRATHRHSEPSSLMFKSTIHSSQNTLRPTLLPFLTELITHIEARLRRVSLKIAPPPMLPVSDLPMAAVLEQNDERELISSMRISFGLRIDQSKLELTCQPDVNVIAGLHWDSGGFFLNVSPGARKVTVTGSVGGLTVGLKHGFLSEDCVRLDARNLAFSVTFGRVDVGPRVSIPSVSVVLDTEFLGAVRFSRLQDILCFKAVWLDRIPIFDNQTASISKAPPKSPGASPLDLSSSKQDFTTVVLVRVRRIILNIDLGKSITELTVDLKEAIARTKLTASVNEVSLSVDNVSISAKGNISGHANVPHCVFQTTRRTDGSLLNVDEGGKVLQLRMTSGALVAVIESDHDERLLHYRAEPLEVEVFDDWSSIPDDGIPQTNRPLQLSFTITSPEIVIVATVGTIPKLMSYGNKFKANLDAQREGASRESKAFRVTRSPKPQNPLSAVAEAMLHSARSRFKEAEAGLSYVIRQHMSLRLDLFRLVVFPRSMVDPEIAQFIGRSVRARLDRVVAYEGKPAERDLHLSFTSMTISRFTHLNHSSFNSNDGKDWLHSLLQFAPEATIVGLPSMKMHMVSEESNEGSVGRQLLYSFHSEFIRREGMKDFEDIYITLNMSLYSWLTILRKNLSREMDQITATVVPRVNRDKTPELPFLADMPKMPTISHPISPKQKPTIAEQSKSASLPSSSSPPGDIGSIPQGSSLLFPPSPEPVPLPREEKSLAYRARSRHIERLTMRQLGEATPDVMHPFFMKKAGFNLEDSLPQYVHEYGAIPLEEIMEVLLKLYSRQLLSGRHPGRKAPE
ncbi:hypothetical protein BD779DRAFT_1669348 [Infundibulicybe gibba]|nr:hypothetical protein BD779DRAFT_1669348 [Infundibulicybe gibba]